MVSCKISNQILEFRGQIVERGARVQWEVSVEAAMVYLAKQEGRDRWSTQTLVSRKNSECGTERKSIFFCSDKIWRWSWNDFKTETWDSSGPRDAFLRGIFVWLKSPSRRTDLSSSNRRPMVSLKSNLLLAIPFYYSGWWFGTCCFFFHILGIIIPTD